MRFYHKSLLCVLLATFLVELAWPPVGFWPAAVFGLAVFAYPLLSTRAISKKQAAFHFFLFGFLSYQRWVYLLVIAIGNSGLIPAWQGAGLLTLFALFLGLVTSLFGVAWSIVARRVALDSKNAIHLKALVLALFLVLWDYLDLRFVELTPVKTIAQDPYLLASLGVIGTLGWQVLFFTTASALAYLYAVKSSHLQLVTRSALLCSLVYLLGFGLGSYNTSKLQDSYQGRQPVALIQDNESSFSDFDSDLFEIATRYASVHWGLVKDLAYYRNQEVSNGEDRELWVQWPEGSVPSDIINDRVGVARLGVFAKKTKGIHLVGGVEPTTFKLGEQELPAVYNVVGLYDQSGYVSHYRKETRFPIGEYIPGDRLFPEIYKYLTPYYLVVAEREPNVLLHPDPSGPIFVASVCWEILFHKKLERLIRLAKLEHPSREVVLTNLSGEGWFNTSSYRDYYSLLIRWQAARFELPLIKSSNTGFSQIIAPWGEVVGTAPVNQMTAFCWGAAGEACNSHAFG